MTRATRIAIALLILPGLMFAAAAAQAHPHAWIDLQVTLERDADGRITHMRHQWRFDPTYGQYLYDDAQQHQPGASAEQRLQGLAREIHANLAEYEWYSHVEAGEDPVAVKPAGPASMAREDDLLFLRFRLALEQPVDAAATPLHYQVYDPTYFIEILHEEAGGTRILAADGLIAADCHAERTRPRPDPAMVARAMALDYGASAEYDLGKHFAERITVRCG